MFCTDSPQFNGHHGQCQSQDSSGRLCHFMPFVCGLRAIHMLVICHSYTMYVSFICHAYFIYVPVCLRAPAFPCAKKSNGFKMSHTSEAKSWYMDLWAVIGKQKHLCWSIAILAPAPSSPELGLPSSFLVALLHTYRHGPCDTLTCA